MTSSTPSSFCTHRVTFAWQAAQVIPVTLYFSFFITRVTYFPRTMSLYPLLVFQCYYIPGTVYCNIFSTFRKHSHYRLQTPFLRQARPASGRRRLSTPSARILTSSSIYQRPPLIQVDDEETDGHGQDHHRMPPARYPAYRSTRVNRGLSPMLSPTSLAGSAAVQAGSLRTAPPELPPACSRRSGAHRAPMAEGRCLSRRRAGNPKKRCRWPAGRKNARP